MVSLVKTDEAILSGLVARLPHDPASIARFLADRDARGKTGDAARCPLVCWFRRTLPGPAVIEVDDFNAWLFASNDVESLYATVGLPRWVTDFVAYFDGGHYPLLIAA